MDGSAGCSKASFLRQKWSKDAYLPAKNEVDSLCRLNHSQDSISQILRFAPRGARISAGGAGMPSSFLDVQCTSSSLASLRRNTYSQRLEPHIIVRSDTSVSSLSRVPTSRNNINVPLFVRSLAGRPYIIWRAALRAHWLLPPMNPRSPRIYNW